VCAAGGDPCRDQPNPCRSRRAARWCARGCVLSAGDRRLVALSVRVQREDFEVDAEVTRLLGARNDIGAVVTFCGIMRGENEGRAVRRMRLEHYPGMTERELERVEREAAGRWPLQASLIVHRIGDFTPGDRLVLVVTAAAHREAAFAAAGFLMD